MGWDNCSRRSKRGGTKRLDGLPREGLADQLVELETGLSGLEAARSRRLARYDASRTASDHFATTSAFLVQACRIAPGRAARLVGQARALAAMPATSQAWAEGRLSQDQTRALVTGRDANPEVFGEHETGLVDTVGGLNVVDTGRAVGYWRRLVNPDRFEADQQALHARRRLHLSQTFEGLWRAGRLARPRSRRSGPHRPRRRHPASQPGRSPQPRPAAG